MAKVKWSLGILAKINEIPLLLSFSLLGLLFVVGFGSAYAGPDFTPPVVTVPTNVTVAGHDEYGAIVEFTATALDETDGVLIPVCNPASFSLFPVGNSTVLCTAQDLSGNIGNATFVVQVLIPQWVKTLAGHWCVDEVDDLSFAQVVNFLVDSEILDRPNEWGAESVLTVPDWAKQNGCWWEADLISDLEFINVILFLIDQGIIMVY